MYGIGTQSDVNWTRVDGRFVDCAVRGHLEVVAHSGSFGLKRLEIDSEDFGNHEVVIVARVQCGQSTSMTKRTDSEMAHPCHVPPERLVLSGAPGSGFTVTIRCYWVLQSILPPANV